MAMANLAQKNRVRYVSPAKETNLALVGCPRIYEDKKIYMKNDHSETKQTRHSVTTNQSACRSSTNRVYRH